MTELDRFEADCRAARVSPADAFRAGGMAASTWFRWKSKATSPTLRSLEAARRGLETVRISKEGHPTSLPDPCDDGADNPSENVSRTSEPSSVQVEVAA